MKELKLYQCELCGTQYASEKFAKDCEESHRIIKEAKPYKYRSLKSNPDGFPDSVIVEFDNGRQIIYKR
jgi:hypothetical protein